MKIEIVKIGETENQHHYRIITPFDVKEEEELLSQKQVIELINDDNYRFEKGMNPTFPNTWFLHVSRKKN